MAGKPDLCPVCGGPVSARDPLVRAWPGKYAHRGCASYERRPRRRGEPRSQRVHRKFTRP